MSELKFSDFESVVRAAVNPEIEEAFKKGQVYKTFSSGRRLGKSQAINGRGYRIPFYSEHTHLWLENAKSMTQMLAGEIEIPHRKLRKVKRGKRTIRREIACDECREATKLRAEYQKEKARNEMLQRRYARIQEQVEAI